MEGALPFCNMDVYSRAKPPSAIVLPPPIDDLAKVDS